MNKNKKILSLVAEILSLVAQKKTITMYYQSNISLLSLYSFDENGKYSYSKSLYLDGFLSSEEQVIKELKQIIVDLKEMK